MDPTFEELHRLKAAYEASLEAITTSKKSYVDEMRRLHGGGLSLRDIGDEVHLSPQRVHQLIALNPPHPVEQLDLPRAALARFSERTKEAIVLAAEEARSLGHATVGPAHLLIGLSRQHEGAAAS